MDAIAIGMEAIAIRVDAIGHRLEAIAIRMEAIAIRMDLNAIFHKAHPARCSVSTLPRRGFPATRPFRITTRTQASEILVEKERSLRFSPRILLSKETAHNIALCDASTTCLNFIDLRK